jgi:N-alpha-acetyl-L-2,4-diaminobutyrate deacetylase
MARQGILTAAIVHEQLAGEIPRNRHWAPNEQILVDNSELSCYVPAEFDGHFEPTVPCGERVSKGQRIALLHDFNRIDEAPAEIVAPHDGFVICQAWQAKVFRGQVISVVSVPRPWMD